MENTREGVMENYKWTAFMKLKGQTWARREKEILDEFEGFVRSLRGVDVGYNVIVMVEGKAPRQIHSEHNTGNTAAKIPREEARP